MMIDDDMCRCGVICICGGEDWGEEYETLDPEWPRSPDN